MAFNLVGTTITQTGTDVDLTELGTIAGVTTANIGVLTYFNLGNLILRYDILTIPYGQGIILPTSSPNNALRPDGANSILTIGEDFQKNGERIARVWSAVIVQKQPTNNADLYNNNEASLRIDMGQLHWWEGTIQTNRVIELGFASGSFIKKGAIIENYPEVPTANTSEKSLQVVTYSTELVVEGLLIKSGINYEGPIWAPRTKLDTPPVLELIGAAGISDHSTFANSDFVEYRDYSSTAADKDINLFDSRRLRVINPEKGSDTKIVEHNNNSYHARGLIELVKEFEATIINLDGDLIEDGVHYVPDYNNGDRRDGFGYTYTDDFDYFGTSNVNGKTGIVRVITTVVAKTDSVALHVDDEGVNKKDRRSKYNDIRDAYDIYFYHHNYFPIPIEQRLNKRYLLEFEATIFVDSRMTETSGALIAAYTTVDILDLIYNYSKYWKKLSKKNFKTVHPLTLLFTASGENLIMPIGWNVLVNSAATTVFAVTQSSGNVESVQDDGSGKIRITSTAHGLITNDRIYIEGTTDYNGYAKVTAVTTDTFDVDKDYVSDQTGSWANNLVTLKTANLQEGVNFKTLKLTEGTIEVLNSEILSIGIEDANGDSYISFSKIDNLQSWVLYPTIIDADNDTNSIGSGTDGDYRFNFITAENWVAKIVTNSNIIYVQINVTSKGESDIVIDQTALLNEINSSIKSVLSSTKHNPSLSVFYDSTATGISEGTRDLPCSTVQSAFIEMVNLNTANLFIKTDITLDMPAINKNITAEVTGLVIDINGQDISGTFISKMTVTGVVATMTVHSVIEDCKIIGTLDEFWGCIRDCAISGATIKPASNETLLINDCKSAIGGVNTSMIIDLTGRQNVNLRVSEYAGSVIITGSTDSDNKVTFESNFTKLTIDVSVTAGDISVRGFGVLTNNSALVIDTDSFMASTGNEGGLTEAERSALYSYFTSEGRQDAFKANITSLATQASINGIITSLGDGVDLTADERSTLYSYFTTENRQDAFKASITSLATQASINTIITSLGDGVDLTPEGRQALYDYFTTNGREENFKANIATLSTQTSVDAIATAISNGITLTAAERADIATAVESAILNESDGKQIIDAIVQAIGNENITQSTLVQAIRADLERTGGQLEVINTKVETNKQGIDEGNLWSRKASDEAEQANAKI